jgi:hypothetical protein
VIKSNRTIQFVFIIALLLFSYTSIAKPHYSFFLENDYQSSGHLFNTLSNEGLRSVNQFFLWCCDCIMYYARSIGVSYAFLNILLFVVLQPLLILIFSGLWLYERRRRKGMSFKI